MGFRKWWFCFALFGLSSFAQASDIVVNTFGGLNTQDSPAALAPYQSQDLQNVLLQPGMKSVFKRDGYGLFQTLPQFSTAAVHGGYHFQQTAGSDVQLWGSDNILYASVSDGAFVKVSTGTDGATWQCTDNLGFAYCVTSNNDTPVKTDGTLANTTFLGSAAALVPAGTLITSTPLQLVVGGVSGSASTLNISANNNFTNFTVGPLATDPYTEIINAPGSRITHVAYYFGKLFWWKDQSFGYLSNTASQSTVSVTIVSNQIGTLDNSSAFWNSNSYETANAFSSQPQTSSQGNQNFNDNGSLGGIFFRGQDNHIYQYDGYTLTRLTRIIAPTVIASGRRKANSVTQTSQSDFSSGDTFVPSVNLSTTVSVGDITVSSFSATENSSASGWGSGTSSNFAIGTSSISLLTNNSGNVTNNGFESAFAGNWTDSGGPQTLQQVTTLSLGCTVSPHGGSDFLRASGHSSPATFTFEIIDLGSTVLASATPSQTKDCAWNSNTITSSSNLGKRVKFRIKVVSDTTQYLTTSDSYIFGGAITFYTAEPNTTFNECFDDITNGSSTITSGSFTSQAFNTNFTSSFAELNAGWTANTVTPSMELQDSANGSAFLKVTSSTGTNKTVRKYVRYVSSITIGGGDSALTSIDSVNVITASTGTYYSSVFNYPSLTTWNTISINDATNGNSSITYYTRASTSPFYVTNSSPPWVAQGKNATVTASTGTYFQLIASFTVTAATETPKLNDFTFNWFEGSAGDKAYITYFQDAIWFAVSAGTSTSTNNQVFYLDLLNNAWLKHNIPANGFLVENNALYFGDPTVGKIYKYGSVTTDNGSAINAYWKSKDFAGDNPTVQNEYQQADFIFNQALSTATYSYSLDQKTATSVSIPTYSSTAGIVKRGFLLPPGKIGTFYNFQVGDNSSFAKWTLLMHRLQYNALNWSPQTQ